MKRARGNYQRFPNSAGDEVVEMEWIATSQFDCGGQTDDNDGDADKDFFEKKRKNKFRAGWKHKRNGDEDVVVMSQSIIVSPSFSTYDPLLRLGPNPTNPSTRRLP